MTQITIHTSASSFTRMLGMIVKRGAQVELFIQSAAMSAVRWSILDSNVEPCNQLLKAMPPSARKDALVAWLEKYGNVAWMKSTKSIAFYDAGNVWDDVTERTMSMDMWHTGKKAPAPVSIHDAVEEVDKFLNRMKKEVKLGKLVHAELIETLARASAQWHGEQARMAEQAELDSATEEQSVLKAQYEGLLRG